MVSEMTPAVAAEASSTFGNEQISLSGQVELKTAISGLIFEVPGSPLKFQDEVSLVGGTIEVIYPAPRTSVIYTISSFTDFRTSGGDANAIGVSLEGSAVPPTWDNSETVPAVISPKNSYSLCSNVFTDVFDYVTSKDGLLGPVGNLGLNLLQTGAAAVDGASTIVETIGSGVKGVFDQSSDAGGGTLTGQIGALSGQIVGTTEALIEQSAATAATQAENAANQARDMAIKSFDTIAGMVQGMATSSAFDVKSLKDMFDSMIPDSTFADTEFPDLCPKDGSVAGAKYDKGTRNVDNHFPGGTGATWTSSTPPSSFLFGVDSGGFSPSTSTSNGIGGCGSTAGVNQFSKIKRDDDNNMEISRKLAFTDVSEDVRIHYTSIYKGSTLRLDQEELVRDKHWEVWVYDPTDQSINPDRSLAVSLWAAAGGGA
jgi:hypothetical protein